MPKYLVRASFKPEGIRQVLTKAKATGLRAAVARLVEAAGGKLEAWYFAFGEDDVIAILWTCSTTLQRRPCPLPRTRLDSSISASPHFLPRTKWIKRLRRAAGFQSQVARNCCRSTRGSTDARQCQLPVPCSIA